MPKEDEKKPCTIEGCPGTMTYSAQTWPPGSRAGFAADEFEHGREGAPVLVEPQPGWLCDHDSDHFQPAR